MQGKPQGGGLGSYSTGKGPPLKKSSHFNFKGGAERKYKLDRTGGGNPSSILAIKDMNYHFRLNLETWKASIDQRRVASDGCQAIAFWINWSFQTGVSCLSALSFSFFSFIQPFMVSRQCCVTFISPVILKFYLLSSPYVSYQPNKKPSTFICLF